MRKICFILGILVASCAGTRVPVITTTIPQDEVAVDTTTVTPSAAPEIIFVAPADIDSAVVWYNRGLEAFQDSNFVFAQECFRRASQLNPNDLDAKIWLATTLAQMGKTNEAVPLYEDIIRVEKGRSDVYYALGAGYHQLGWDSLAVESLKSAIYVLQQTDSTAQIPSVYWETLGDAYVGINNGKGATNAYIQALLLARNQGDSAYFQRKIDWISWDNGNIPAVRLRDEADMLASNGSYQQAAGKYQTAITLAKTEKARAELLYSLAIIKYQHLNNPEVAIGLLRRISSANLIYYDALGMVLHNEGVRMVNERNLKQALIYLTEAAQLAWKLQPLSCLELARLYSQFPTKTAEAVKWAEKAVELGISSAVQQGEAYQLLISLNRRLGNFEAMKKWGEKLK